jgi:hypothetical protein
MVIYTNQISIKHFSECLIEIQLKPYIVKLNY